MSSILNTLANTSDSACAGSPFALCVRSPVFARLSVRPCVVASVHDDICTHPLTHLVQTGPAAKQHSLISETRLFARSCASTPGLPTSPPPACSPNTPFSTLLPVLMADDRTLTKRWVLAAALTQAQADSALTHICTKRESGGQEQ